MTRPTRAAAFLSALTVSAVGVMTFASAALAQSGAPPAKGARIGDVIWGTVAATLATAAVIWVAVAHRDGRIRWLGRLAKFSSRVSGLPGWAALPAAVTGGSLLIAVFGFYWDVAKHIDTGRDPSPFGTPAHYPILIGLFGIAVGGFLAIVLGADGRDRASVRIAEGWRAPLGGILIFLCGGFALIGFPLDDVWHTLFGQDVTLWGPTHVLMIAGASLATLGVWVLLVEGQRATAEARAADAGGAGGEGPSGLGRRASASARGTAALDSPGGPGSSAAEPWYVRLRVYGQAGGFLLGMSTLQGEFDYGVPQFQLVFQPILLAIAASVALVVARARLGRGGALKAVSFYLLVRGALTLIIGPGFGLSTLHFPLYIVEALIVEGVALRVGTQRPLTLGAVAGALIGTVGLAAEWGWSHVWMPLPWPASVLPEGFVLGFIAAVAGGVVGGYVARSLNSTEIVPQRGPRWLLPVAGAALIACIGFPLPMTAGPATTATLALRDVQPPPHREVAATVRLSPPTAARGADWLTATAWQGGGLVVDRLQRIGDGVYRTTAPIPVWGKWKAMLRLENGRGVRAVPIYLPADPAIPAKAVPAVSGVTRPFVRDKKILQREAVGGSAWLTTPAYLLLLAIAAGWLAGLGWGLRRLELTARGEVPDRPRAGRLGFLGRRVATS